LPKISDAWPPRGGISPWRLFLNLDGHRQIRALYLSKRHLAIKGEHCNGRLSMMKKIVTMVFCIILLITFGLAVKSPCEAQQKHKRTYKQLGQNSKYTDQHTIDVGDIPGHQIRVALLHRAQPADNPLKYEGIAVKEAWEHIFSDYINWNGYHWGYTVTIMENGDKIYSRFDGTTHTTPVTKGGAKGTFHGTTTITGGTGKFKGIRGTINYNGIFDTTTFFNENTLEEEYWIE
jgi:hypothetical protein